MTHNSRLDIHGVANVQVNGFSKENRLNEHSSLTPEALLARATKARGMTRRHVLEAICCVLPMSGMVTGQIGFRAMKLADTAA